MSVHKAIMGLGPAWDDVHVGRDGQLWRWVDGQTVVAASGAAAVEYARERNWPEELVDVLKIGK